VEAFDSTGKSVGVIFVTASPFDTPLRMQDMRMYPTVLEPLLSDHTYSNFIAAGSYRTKNQKRYECKSKEMILQATYLCTYLQLLIIDGTLKLLESKEVKRSRYFVPIFYCFNTRSSLLGSF